MPSRAEFLQSDLEVVVLSQDTTCSICKKDDLSRETIVRLPCHESHMYCDSCIRPWLSQRGVNSCPDCRTELFDKDIDEESEDDEEDEADEYNPQEEADFWDDMYAQGYGLEEELPDDDDPDWKAEDGEDSEDE